MKIILQEQSKIRDEIAGMLTGEGITAHERFADWFVPGIRR